MNALSDSEITAFRKLYPFLQTGHIYLNHAATSPLSTKVTAAMQADLDARSSGAIELYFSDIRILPVLKGRIATLIGAESPDRIALLGNTSEALNVVASGLTWRSGDRILLNDMEFPANVYPYLNLKREGVEVDTIPCPDGRLLPEMVERALHPRTRLVAISAVQFLSGYRSDLAAIGKMCRAKNILFVVDGIQAVGAVTVDVVKMHIDALAAGAQKWLMGPQGTGFLYVSERLQEMIHQRSLGWLSLKVPWNFRDYGQPLDPTARRYEGGTLNFIGLKGFNASMEILTSIGRERLEGRILTLTGHLISRVDVLKDVGKISPTKDAERAGIVTIRMGDAARAQTAFETLGKEKITISIREGLLRFSPHYYNTTEELDRCVAVLSGC